jgi:hypothetical protein
MASTLTDDDILHQIADEDDDVEHDEDLEPTSEFLDINTQRTLESADKLLAEFELTLSALSAEGTPHCAAMILLSRFYFVISSFLRVRPWLLCDVCLVDEFDTAMITDAADDVERLFRNNHELARTFTWQRLLNISIEHGKSPKVLKMCLGMSRNPR